MDIRKKYFDWMVSKIQNKSSMAYRDLLIKLDSIQFTYIIPLDANRYEDGISLRYRFGQDCNVPPQIVANEIDIRPCSVLEMMIALALRCEEDIMDDWEVGNRTGQWFWAMISSLGLEEMKGSWFDGQYVDSVIERLLNRQFKPNGRGGLFTLQNPPQDLRTVEFWYQAMWYLSERG